MSKEPEFISTFLKPTHSDWKDSKIPKRCCVCKKLYKVRIRISNSPIATKDTIVRQWKYFCKRHYHKEIKLVEKQSSEVFLEE